MTIAIGDTIPPFATQSTSGSAVTPDSLRGKAYVLYFYPKDNTPGCTLESQQFRDLHGDFQAAGCQVFGVSRDSLKSHDRFREGQCLPFDLLSDPDETLCRLFDVIKTKNMYGKQVQGIERSTFLVDADGVLVAEWRKVKADGHAQAVLERVRAG